jgi:ABC-2 type transport system permease protein
MKGILRKDLLLAWKNMKYLLLAFVIFTLGMVSQDSETRILMTGMYLCLIGVLTPLYTFSYDRTAHWDVYARALPVERWKIVLAKYLLGLVFLAAGLLLGGAVIAVSGFLGAAQETGRMIGSLAGMMAGGLLLLSLQLPFFYRFGPEKARLLIVVTIFLVAALFGASLSVENTSGLSLLFSLLNPTPMASFLLIAAAFFLVVGSFFLCVRIYCKREE